jgi:hypothetical protein
MQARFLTVRQGVAPAWTGRSLSRRAEKAPPVIAGASVTIVMTGTAYSSLIRLQIPFQEIADVVAVDEFEGCFPQRIVAAQHLYRFVIQLELPGFFDHLL